MQQAGERGRSEGVGSCALFTPCPVVALPGAAGYERGDNCSSAKKGDVSYCDFKHGETQELDIFLRCLASIMLSEQLREARFTEHNCRHYQQRRSLALELSYITTQSLEQATPLFV